MGDKSDRLCIKTIRTAWLAALLHFRITSHGQIVTRNCPVSTCQTPISPTITMHAVAHLITETSDRLESNAKLP